MYYVHLISVKNVGCSNDSYDLEIDASMRDYETG